MYKEELMKLKSFPKLFYLLIIMNK